jgi:hypothetical protein
VAALLLLLVSVPVAILLPAVVPVLAALPLPLLLALPAAVPVPPLSGTIVCVPLPSVHGYSLGGIVLADASSAACDKRSLVKTSQPGRCGEAGMAFVMEMGRLKIV